jgi:hypothetical protein
MFIRYLIIDFCADFVSVTLSRFSGV